MKPLLSTKYGTKFNSKFRMFNQKFTDFKKTPFICNSKPWLLCESLSTFWMHFSWFRNLLRRAILKSVYRSHPRNPLLRRKGRPLWIFAWGALVMSGVAQWASCLLSCLCCQRGPASVPLPCIARRGAVSNRTCFSLFLCKSLPWHSSNITLCCCNAVTVTWACSELNKFAHVRSVASVTLQCGLNVLD